MYPSSDLNRLLRHKAALRRRIAVQRRDCTAAAGTLARPVAWLDRAIALGRQFAPLARAALGPLGLAWSWFRRPEKTRRGRGWFPLLLAAAQLFARWQGRRPG
jgi:hypothetical protein